MAMSVAEESVLASDCPMMTADLPGAGGVLKARPEDFVVEEIPAYQPCGDGEHLFLWIEKTGVAADQLGRHLAEVLGISPRDLGTAGLKDTHAVTRQFVSVPRSAERRLSAIDSPGIRLLSAAPHGNKLRTGHLRGNRFQILVRSRDAEDSVDRTPTSDQADQTQEPLTDVAVRSTNSQARSFANAQAIAERLRRTGVPNYFGSQRFGNKLSTLKLGLKLLTEARDGGDRPREAARPNRRFLHRLALSAAQSWLFNTVLADRLRDVLLDRVMLGDVMQKCVSGGLFDVRDVAVEQPRFAARETVLTGPMFGPKMRPALHEPGIREQRVLASAGLTLDGFRRFGHLAEGTRRPMLIWPDDLKVDAVAEGLMFEFSLPPGAYATVVLREFMKSDAEAEPGGSSADSSDVEDQETATC